MIEAGEACKRFLETVVRKVDVRDVEVSVGVHFLIFRFALQGLSHGREPNGTMNGKCGARLLTDFWSAVTSSHPSRSARAT
jgi:hypothetical protein